MLKNKLFQNTLAQYKLGLWELSCSLTTDEWSQELYEHFGLENNKIEPSYEYFINEILHPEDLLYFETTYHNYKEEGINFKNQLRLKSANGVYDYFTCFSTDEAPITINSDKRLIFFQRVNHFEKDENPFSFEENTPISKAGSWYVDFKNKKSHWDIPAKRILGYADDYEPSLAESVNYYAPDYRQQAADTFFACSTNGKSFKSEIKMLTKEGKEIWVSTIGRAIRDEKNRIIGIKGVFQDIDEVKKREISLKKSIKQMASQNDRLFNFAHIVSHNLRSHSSNLGLLVQLIESIDDPAEKLGLLNEVKTVSNSLATTIEHLNEIVNIQASKEQAKTDIHFSDTMTTVKNAINNIIINNNAKITEDFSKQNSISYVPAYLESILLNLLTNAIKYKHADRLPEIYLETGINTENKTYLKFSDNGRGIDLEKFGKDLFGMYKTFHYNNDAVGIGLFITKNQIESLGGTIEVESTLNQGTIFTITF